MAEPGEPGGGAALIDARFEFDAPRFYDFDEGSPEGSQNAADRWFDTSATKGLASPLAAAGKAAAGAPRQLQQAAQVGGWGVRPAQEGGAERRALLASLGRPARWASTV